LQHRHWCFIRSVADVHCCNDLRWNKRWVTDAVERNENDSSGEMLDYLAGESHSQSRLADSTWPGECNEPHGPPQYEIPHFLEIFLAAHQCCPLRRQIQEPDRRRRARLHKATGKRLQVTREIPRRSVPVAGCLG